MDSLFPMDELSLIGFTEVLPHVPHLARPAAPDRPEIDRRRPDLVLTIDSPGFALRLQHRLRRLPLLRIHYVAPQVWAWRASSAPRGLPGDLDHLLALLPFEPAFFERHGLACSFVGHPIIEEAGRPRDGPRFRRRYDIAHEAPLLCLLPGSRRTEIAHHLPVLGTAVAPAVAAIAAAAGRAADPRPPGAAGAQRGRRLGRAGAGARGSGRALRGLRRELARDRGFGHRLARGRARRLCP